MDQETKRFHVIGAPIYDPGNHPHSGRFKYHGEFDTRKDAEEYIRQNNLKDASVLDSNDRIDT